MTASSLALPGEVTELVDVEAVLAGTTDVLELASDLGVSGVDSVFRLVNLGPSPSVRVIECLEGNVGAKVSGLFRVLSNGCVARVTERFGVREWVVGGVRRVGGSSGWTIGRAANNVVADNSLAGLHCAMAVLGIRVTAIDL